MKIGAGGLQSLASMDIAPVRKVDSESSVRRKEVYSAEVSQVEIEINKEDLIKAVGSLNKEAKAYNQPLEFMVKEYSDGNLLVLMVNKESKDIYAEIQSDTIIKSAQEPLKNIGLLIDQYL